LQVAHIDPDIQHLPVFAISPVFFQSITSAYHKTKMHFDGVAQFLVPYQVYLYYPIMAVARFNLYAQSYMTVLTSRDANWVIEIVLMLAFVGWYSFATSFFGTWGERFTFIMVSHALAGILHLQIVSSHFAMPALDTFEATSFVKDQLATTIDIVCPPYMDWFHGGLQFQTIHHLMPRVPRPYLRKCADIVKTFCKEHDLNYRETGWFNSQRMVLNTLDMTAKECKNWSPIIVDAINLQG
jgi:delta8-fatty-acid desaturase